jgi:predicted esterase
LRKFDWQPDDLAETVRFLKQVLEYDIIAIGAQNVFPAGFSKGCAMWIDVLKS